jgi:hypothetical protein
MLNRHSVDKFPDAETYPHVELNAMVLRDGELRIHVYRKKKYSSGKLFWDFITSRPLHWEYD